MYVVRNKRLQAGLTQAQLAALTGLDGVKISKIENGIRKLAAEEITAMARALQCDPLELLSALHAEPSIEAPEKEEAHA